MTSLLATGKFNKKILQREPQNQHHPHHPRQNQEVWRKLSEKKNSLKKGLKKFQKKKIIFKEIKKYLQKPQKSGSKEIEMDQTMGKTETLDYTDEYTAHLIGLELSFNLDR